VSALEPPTTQALLPLNWTLPVPRQRSRRRSWWMPASLTAASTPVSRQRGARNHLTLRALQQRQAVTEASLVNQREALALSVLGWTPGVDTARSARARTLVSTEAALPALQSNVERTVFRLTLTAQPPRRLLAELVPQVKRRNAFPPVTDLSALPLGTTAAAPS
jgi:multidrug efflux system outer membrane protein